MKETKVLGIPLTVIRKQELIKELERTIREKRQEAIAAVNARKIVRAFKEPDVEKLLQKFDVFLADGSSVVRAASEPLERITGVDLMEDICAMSERTGARIFFYGATEEQNARARKHLKEKYPRMQIAGACNGYDGMEDPAAIINEVEADVVLVALGTPKQEEWIIKNRDNLSASVLLGVGGAFDIYSGSKKRAPLWIQRAGFEWLYRMLREPERFRQIPELLEFRRLLKKEQRRKNRV